jgi:hypothetical protein
MAGLGLLTFQEEEMGKIVIKDLSENVDLDRKAMRAISGGARLRAQGGAVSAKQVREPRIVDFRTGVVTQSAKGKAAK